MSLPLKTIALTFTLVAAIIYSYGQQKASGATGPSEEVIQQRLVELALKSPKYRAAEHLNKVNEYQLKRTKNVWLNSLGIAYNVNDQTFKQQATNTGTPNVYPKYTFGVNVPLGIIFSHADTKAAREQVNAGRENQEELARTIKRDVLIKYADYKANEELLINQTKIIDNISATFLQTEQQFKDGTINVELYNAASRAKNMELTQRVQLQKQQTVTKLELEAMIGVPLESVLK